MAWQRNQSTALDGLEKNEGKLFKQATWLPLQQHGCLVVSINASQQENPGFEPWVKFYMFLLYFLRKLLFLPPSQIALSISGQNTCEKDY